MDCSWIEAILNWNIPVDDDRLVTDVDFIEGMPFQNAEVVQNEPHTSGPGEQGSKVEDLCEDVAGEEELPKQIEHLDESDQVEHTANEEEPYVAKLPKEIKHPDESNQAERIEAVNKETKEQTRAPDCFQEDGDRVSKSGCIKSHQHSQPALDPSSPDSQDAPLDMDPLVARAYHNLTKSWLLQFPTDILIAIMEQLEDSDLLRLRRTCRIFMIHFGFKAFQRCHRRGEAVLDELGWNELWQCSSMVDVTGSDRPPDDILKEIYCTSCFTALDKRYAGGRTPEQDPLHCGGCGSDHQAQVFSATQSRMPPQERICIGLEGRFNLCEHVSFNWKDLVKTLESGNTRVAECSHPSHNFAPDHYSDQSAERLEADVVCYDGDLYYLELTKETHVSLDKQGRDKPTAQQLRRRLRDIERISPCPWYPLDFARISPMRLVDPNICLCLEYQGADRIDWHMRGPIGDPVAGAEFQERCWSGSKAGDDPQVCDNRAHTKQTSYYNGVIITAFAQCRDGCAKLRQERRICIGLEELRPSSIAWYKALDPLSFDLPDFFGVAWCMSKWCRNYFKHLWNNATGREFLAGKRFSWRVINQKCRCPDRKN
ncbi:hypothetical protein PVAG01_09508 [Phlyctema vagabunda]|uniref:F-box domain-containing protein n=1 Tax=Phlyctema vagabunda TaxID=108571 RepID=A0ABR4P880_9HELO